MNTLNRIKSELVGETTLVARLQNGEIFKSQLRGIAPILRQLQENEEFFQNASVADKVVGKAAALLYIKAGISELYALILSKPSLEILKKHNIKVRYDNLVDRIENRAHTGLCPMESLCLEIDDPENAFSVLKNAVK